MHPTHALASPRYARWLGPGRLALFLTLLLSLVGGAVQATPRCDDLRVSLGSQPEWYARECVVSLITPAPTANPDKAGTDLAYAFDVSPESNNFISHQLDNFPGQSVEGVANRVIVAMDFNPDATILYAIAKSPWELGTINLGTGSFTAIGPSAPPSGEWTGLAVHPGNGTIYAASSNLTSSSLSTLNSTTGLATLIGTDSSVDAIIAIAANCEGQIYGHDIVVDTIFEIDPATGLATIVGPTGVNSNFGQGMDFDNESGVLYAWTFQGGAQAFNRYGTISLVNGSLTTLANSMPLGRFEGATMTTCDGIEPPTPIFTDGFETGNLSRWTAAVL